MLVRKMQVSKCNDDPRHMIMPPEIAQSLSPSFHTKDLAVLTSQLPTLGPVDRHQVPQNLSTKSNYSLPSATASIQHPVLLFPLHTEPDHVCARWSQGSFAGVSVSYSVDNHDSPSPKMSKNRFVSSSSSEGIHNDNDKDKSSFSVLTQQHPTHNATFDIHDCGADRIHRTAYYPASPSWQTRPQAQGNCVQPSKSPSRWYT